MLYEHNPQQNSVVLYSFPFLYCSSFWLPMKIVFSPLTSCCCSVTKSCQTLCEPMNCSTPGSSVHHYLPGFARTHVPWVSETIQPSHPLSPPSPFALSFSQYQGLFQWVSLFTSGGQSTGASASAPAFPVNIQGWFPLGLTGLILLSKGLSGVFSSTTVQKRLFFGTQPSLWFSSHIDTWLLGKHSFNYMDLCGQSDIFAF